MKKLREGYTTGSCMTGAALASVLWQTGGKMPEKVQIDTPAGRVLVLDVCGYEKYTCGIKKYAGDDPDVTDGCIVKVSVEISDHDGEISFVAGEGVGTVTRKGLKVPPGEPAVNPVPRRMTEETVRRITGSRAAVVTVSVEDGEKIAEKTFNQRLGITGGISILGTSGIVRPMSEEAVKDSLALELSQCRAEYGTRAAFVTGYSGEDFLRSRYGITSGVVLCSNYLGFLLDEALESGFTDIIIAGGAGKLVKPAAGIMYLHSHTAGGQREILGVHAAMHDAPKELVREIYNCSTTRQMCDVLRKNNMLETVLDSVVNAAAENCRLRTLGKINIAYILTDENNEPAALSEGSEEIIGKWSEENA